MPTELLHNQPELVQNTELRHAVGFADGTELALPAAGLPEGDPIYKKLDQAGVTGSVLVDITAGDQQFVVVDSSETAVIDKSAPDQKLCYKPFNDHAALRTSSPREFNSPFVLIHVSKDGQVKGVALNKGAEPIRAGREDDKNRSNRFIVADHRDAPLLSRDHFSIAIDKHNQLHITDLGSRDGTLLRFNNATVDEADNPALKPMIPRYLGHSMLSEILGIRKDGEPDYANALDMQADELWATPNNGGRKLDKRHERYIELNRQLREQVVRGFRDGDIYRDAETFINFFKQLHRTPGLAENYNDLVSADKHIELATVGEFKTHTGTAPRTVEPTRVAEIAAKYGDPYGLQGEPGTSVTRRVRMPNIPEKYCAEETIEYRADGSRRSIYTYPHASSLTAYFEQAAKLGKTIEASIKGGSGDPEQVLSLIAHQYQYLVLSRPFRRINNSLFMQLANAQTKMLGYNGMTHGMLDHAAYRMTYENFAKYFSDHAKGLTDEI
jgi:hypothetical protein